MVLLVSTITFVPVSAAIVIGSVFAWVFLPTAGRVTSHANRSWLLWLGVALWFAVVATLIGVYYNEAQAIESDIKTVDDDMQALIHKLQTDCKCLNLK
jgi:predicted PurR-regulated permease PerM